MAALEAARKMNESAGRQKSAGAVREVDFAFRAPSAKKVCVAGTFNNWNPNSIPMKKEKDGTWKIKVKLAAGKYEYKYVVDGTWAQDVPCAESVRNSFGTYNCVIGV
jgi:1,4-alpha-glucan branching enzyme